METSPRRGLLTINLLHHHGEDGEVRIAVVIPIPVVAVEATLIPVQLEPVAVRARECVIFLPKHHPLNALRAESNSVS